MENTEFIKQLSDEGQHQAEAIEKEMADLLAEGFSRKFGLGFVQTVMELRAKGTAGSVNGTLEAVMLMGLCDLRIRMDLESQAQRKPAVKRRKTKLSKGV